MPFTMHGQDLVFINYFPMMFIKKGIWDPYGFISVNFPHALCTYYGPFLFIIMSIVNLICVKLFNALTLIKILEISGTMMFKQFATVDYVYAFSELGLFKNLFLMKIPYLVFDFLIGVILLKLAISKKTAMGSYKLWMLNIVVLHSAYMVGQFDLIPAFFIIAALFAAVKKRPYLSIVSLSLGGATKLFPYILILPACLLLGHNWKKRFLLLFVGGILTLSLYLPFYLSSGNSVFGFFIYSSLKQYSGIAKWILMGIFIILYGIISIKAVRESANPGSERQLLYYFLVIGLLTYTIAPISFRYFVFITPLLALVLPQHKRFAVLILFIILMLAFLRLPTRDLQWGLFVPLNPEYFINLPTIQEIAQKYLNIEIAYKIMSRVLMLAFFAAAWWAWRIKLISEEVIDG